MGCRSAVNRCFLSRLAACRTRSSALGVLSRPGVRSALHSGEFPLASSLPSLASAAGPSAVFREFVGTVELSDFPRPFVIGFRPSTSRHGLQFSPLQTDVGSPGSLTRCLPTCTGSLTARDPATPCDGGAPGVAFRHPPTRRHPGVPAACAAGHIFHGSIPDLYVPLSTLRRRPRERLRMTRGRCGSLFLQRMKLSFTTPCRFRPAHGGAMKQNHIRLYPSNPSTLPS